MKSYLDRLNLRPFEKRLVVGVGVILFIVFNVWFVVPHFSDWGNARWRMNKARATLDNYQKEIQQIPKYKATIDKLMKSGSQNVPPEDQAIHFATAVQAQATSSKVSILQTSRILARTNNVFFLEQTQGIVVSSKEPELVDFLFRLGSGDSLIRVRDLSLKTDAPRQALMSNIKLVASYQKKLPTRAPAAGSRPVRAAPGAPATQPATPSK